MSASLRKVHDLILVISLLSTTCFVPSSNGDPTIHVDEHQATWKSAMERCAGRGERLVSPQNLSDKDKDRILPKLEKDVWFWTLHIHVSQVVVWAGCVQEASPRALSQHDIPMTVFGKQNSLSKCLGYCLMRNNYTAVGLRDDGFCWCFSDMKALTSATYCDHNCSATGMDECEKNFISLYHLVPKGKVLSTEEELLGTGKCVYYVHGADKYFDISSCDKTMPGFLCQSHSGENYVHYRSATWQEANRECRKARMTMSSFWDQQQFQTSDGVYLWMGFFVSPTPIISPFYDPENFNCPIIWKTEKGNLKLGEDDCEHSHRYVCIQDKKSIENSGSSDRVSQIIGAVVGSFVAVLLIASVAVFIYRRRANGWGLNMMIFDNRMYQEVMETDRLGCRPAVRNESNQVSNTPCEEKRMSDIYAAYAEITESPVLAEANPGPAAKNSKISQRFQDECLHYASSNITHLTGNTNISTITEQCGRQTLVEDDTKPVADPEKQREKEYETIF